MPRSISISTQKELNALVAGAREVLVLLEITQEQLAVPIRVVNDTAAIISNGDRYEAFPFRINLPADQDSVAVRSATSDPATSRTAARQLSRRL